MNNYTIKIIKTTNNTILKFEINQFITNHQSFEFSNIDEAKNSPLAQQLFYLPFVKKVYISSNFIAIERYDIVEWNDVKDQVAQQIEEYLNKGGIIINDTVENNKKIPIIVYAESTPNPSVLKFVTNKKLFSDIYEFSSIDETGTSPLAKELFHFPFVKKVFFDENYISITKYDIANWNDITMELREFIKTYIEKGQELISNTASSNIIQLTDENYDSFDDISKQIIDILNEHVKPAVASDGGNIQFKSYNENTKTVQVILQGACSGCPSSTFTLKNGIEAMLKDMLQESRNC